MKYGYNDSGTKGCGVVHIFKDTKAFQDKKPFCGKQQHYIPASVGELPHCQRCVQIIIRAKQGSPLKRNGY